MKKLILSLAVLTFTAAIVNGQDKMMAKKSTISLAVNGGIPTTSGYKVVFGADVQVDLALSENMKFTASGGYENYSYKEYKIGTITIPEGHTNFIPVLAGVKYNFSPKFYGHGQLGYGFSTEKGGGGAFAYAPSVGTMLGQNLDLSLKYLGLSKNSTTLGAIFLRLAYNF
jgi:hypothetical protein